MVSMGRRTVGRWPGLSRGPGGSDTHRSEKVPTGQGRGIPVPTGQKWPGGQGPPAVVRMSPSGWVTSAPADMRSG